MRTEPENLMIAKDALSRIISATRYRILIPVIEMYGQPEYDIYYPNRPDTTILRFNLGGGRNWDFVFSYTAEHEPVPCTRHGCNREGCKGTWKFIIRFKLQFQNLARLHVLCFTLDLFTHKRHIPLFRQKLAEHVQVFAEHISSIMQQESPPTVPYGPAPTLSCSRARRS